MSGSTWVQINKSGFGPKGRVWDWVPEPPFQGGFWTQPSDHGGFWGHKAHNFAAQSANCGPSVGGTA